MAKTAHQNKAVEMEKNVRVEYLQWLAGQVPEGAFRPSCEDKRRVLRVNPQQVFLIPEDLIGLARARKVCVPAPIGGARVILHPEREALQLLREAV